MAGQSTRRLSGQRRVEHTGSNASIGWQGDRHCGGSLRVDESGDPVDHWPSFGGKVCTQGNPVSDGCSVADDDAVLNPIASDLVATRRGYDFYRVDVLQEEQCRLCVVEQCPLKVGDHTISHRRDLESITQRTGGSRPRQYKRCSWRTVRSAALPIARSEPLVLVSRLVEDPMLVVVEEFGRIGDLIDRSEANAKGACRCRV